MLLCLYNPAVVDSEKNPGRPCPRPCGDCVKKDGTVYFSAPGAENLAAAPTLRRTIRIVPVDGDGQSMPELAYDAERAALPVPGVTLGDVWPVGGELTAADLADRCATAAPAPGHPLLVALMALKEASAGGTRPWVARRLA